MVPSYKLVYNPLTIDKLAYKPEKYNITIDKIVYSNKAINKLVHQLTIDISTISPPYHSFKLAVVRSFAPGHGKGLRNVFCEVLRDVFTIGKIAPEHDHLLGELPRSLEIKKKHMAVGQNLVPL